jgi:hypothetical protein
MQHRRHIVTQLAFTTLLATLPFGCSLEGAPDGGTGGTGGSGAAGSGTGGSAGQGGSLTGGTGGASGSGGTSGKGGVGGVGGSAGAGATGGASGSSGTGGTAGTPQGGAGGLAGGGSAGMGGADNGGGAGAGAGGVRSEAGASGSAGSAGSAGSGGSAGKGGSAGSGGSAGGGACQKGSTQGNEVLFIGESFIALSAIPEETTKRARAAGSLGASDSYVDRSVAGTWIGNGASNSIPSQYRNNSDGVRFVLMNGGGNDCWQGGQASHRTAALDAARTLFEDMAENGVEKVVYFFYPDPIGNQYASLTACLNLLRPDMKQVCEGSTSPKCYWVDLRETWNGHPEYTSDGIHVAMPGDGPTAGAIFASMQANCVAP